MLKTSIAAPALAAAARQGTAARQARPAAKPSNSKPAPAKPGAGRERLLLDFGWRFHFGHADDPAKDFGFGAARSGNFQKTGGFLSASSLAFDDSDWKSIELPHDWAIQLPFENDPALASKGFYPLGRKYPETSIGWYRRLFDLPASDAGRRISIEFDGAYRETMVVFNGFYIGRHSGGYDPFRFDVTDFAAPGAPNVLVVRVDATLSDGWFYEGAGIYRHVWLVKTHPVHVKQWGAFARARVRSGEAAVSIRTEVNNHGKGAQSVRVLSTILDPSGKAVGKAVTAAVSIPEWGANVLDQEVAVKKPALWSLEERNLYRLVTEIEAGGATVDHCESPFGIRSVKFDPESGFFLNDKPVKIRGTCNHQDHAGLGAALPNAVQRFRIGKLTEMGCNGYRTSHNPPTPELLDACDELGMLVLDEARMMSSNPEGLSQFENLIRRDRNHPSVIMWSMGNEEGTANTERGKLILTSMKEVATLHDGSRPVTIAPIRTIGVGGLEVCDVMGYNYMDPGAEAYHKAHPDIPVIGTETVSAVGTRGIYVTDPKKGYVGSYDPYTTTGRASAEGWWKFCNAQPWLAGGFVWTGFDYRGEPSPYQWPNISSQYGIIDTCGFPKDSFYYYQSWWTSHPVLHMFPHWNWPGLEGQEIAVWVYTNLDRVELFHNGRSLGAQQTQKDGHLAWIVKYEPGTIEARGYRNGSQVMTAKRETTGTPSKLMIKPDRDQISADGEDVAMFAVEVHDAQGRVVPVADNEMSFRVTGPGNLIGVGNGDPTDHESDKGSSRKAFSGLCMAIVQSAKVAGSITIEATSPGLSSASVAITSREVKLRPQSGVWEREIPAGTGVTGLWRPVPPAAGTPQALFGGGAGQVFTLIQEGDTLKGTVEGAAFGGGEAPVPIEEGKVEGGKITFKTGNTTYGGTVEGDELKLQRTGGFGGRGAPAAAPAPAGKRPAIGPPPDGSDPSRGASGGFRTGQTPPPLILRRAKR